MKVKAAGCDTGRDAGDSAGFPPKKAFAEPAEHVDEKLVQGNRPLDMKSIYQENRPLDIRPLDIG